MSGSRLVTEVSTSSSVQRLSATVPRAGGKGTLAAPLTKASGSPNPQKHACQWMLVQRAIAAAEVDGWTEWFLVGQRMRGQPFNATRAWTLVFPNGWARLVGAT